MSSARPGRRFEVMAQREGRWLIDCLAASEVDALARAEQLYADDRIGAVRVVRAHFGSGGRSFESKIMERVREGKRSAPPLRLAAPPDDEAFCESLADFYGPSSRYAISRLLRNFLDRYQITPTELLHNQRWIKLLDNQDSLLPSAIQRMAAMQAATRDLDRRVRVDAIDAWVSEATGRARDALASRTAPKLGEDGLAALAEAVATRTPDPAEQGFWLRYGVSRGFEELNLFAARFETIMSWVASEPPPALLPLIDELVAGLMGATSMIKDTLGHQPHLGAALHALADLACGRQDSTLAGAPPGFPALAKLMSSAAMPETRSVLYERLQREIAADKPLSRDDPKTQRALFEVLLDKLADDSGMFPVGGAMVAAIARRSRRFDIIGGVEDVRLTGSSPAARLDELLALEPQMASQRQQQSIATYLREAIDRFDGDPAFLAGLSGRIGSTGLPEVTRKALIARIPSASAAATS